MTLHNSDIEAHNVDNALPFFLIEHGSAVVFSPDGKSRLPDDWTGIVCAGDDVHSHWHFGREDGERTFTKLGS